MVGLQTLDLAIGVRVPASQLCSYKHLRAAHKLPVFSLYHYCVTALLEHKYIKLLTRRYG